MGAPTVNANNLNSLLAGFLISSLPVSEQLIPRQWLHRIHSIPDQCKRHDVPQRSLQREEKKKRGKLLRNLLIGLLRSELPNIFKEPPPPGPLPELEDVVPTLDTPSTQWANELAATDLPDNVVQPSSFKFSTPSEFLSKQPTPCNGAFCYGVVFSEISPLVTFSKN